jgi:SOS-response transcriptional repressor LexA
VGTVETISAGNERLNGLIREALSKGRTIKIRARGGSMKPFIPDGSVVEIAAAASPPRTGDVVAAAIGDHLFIHRVIAAKAQVHLQGDARRNLDAPFDYNDILGVVVRVTTPNGWIMRLDTPAASVMGTVLARWSKIRPKLQAIV